MKKIIGIIGVAVFAIALFLNASTIIENNENIDLVSLTTLTAANAEDQEPQGFPYKYPVEIYCHSWSHTIGSDTYHYDNIQIDCIGQGAAACQSGVYDVLTSVTN